jgi:hypothetical protein
LNPWLAGELHFSHPPYWQTRWSSHACKSRNR